MTASAHIQAFFHTASHTVSYLLADPGSRRAAVIDPVLDFDYPSGRISFESARQLLQAVQQQGLTLDWILETHAHADHLSAAQWLKQQTGAKVAIGEHICAVQKIFCARFNLDDVSEDGREFDRLLKEGDVLALGDVKIKVLHTPGHTPACVAYCVKAHVGSHANDAVFVGDTLFMPDTGTARADFPGGNARTLYRSIRRLLALPPQTKLFMCHDYKPENYTQGKGRDTFAWESTVAQQRAHNIHIHADISEDDFVALRQERDATLPAPTLLLPAIQVNIRAGRLPQEEANGVRYLKIPLRITKDPGF